MSPTVSVFVQLAADRVIPIEPAERPLTGQIADLLERVARGMSFAADARRRYDEIRRLAALSDAELEAEGLRRDAVVHRAYWLEFSN